MNTSMNNGHSLCLRILMSAAASLFAITLLSCDEFFPNQAKPDVPVDHTRNISGTLHRPGLFDPLDPINGCQTPVCHGNDLRGGVAFSSGRRVAVPSCYQCHGALWEGEGEEGREHDDD